MLIKPQDAVMSPAAAMVSSPGVLATTQGNANPPPTATLMVPMPSSVQARVSEAASCENSSSIMGAIRGEYPRWVS